MKNLCIPIVHPEETMDRGSVCPGGYGAADPIGTLQHICISAADMTEECFILSAVRDGWVGPIQIQAVTAPQDSVPYRLHAQKMYRTAVASDARALILLHNSPARIADLKKDITTYKEVKDVGDRIGIPLVDYVVLTGGMLHGIYEAPFSPSPHWAGLNIIGCTVCRQPFRVDSEEFCIVSAYPPKREIPTIDAERESREKPFEIGI